MKLALIKDGYKLREYVPALRDIEKSTDVPENVECRIYEIRLQRTFVIECFGAADAEKRSLCWLLWKGKEERNGGSKSFGCSPE